MAWQLAGYDVMPKKDDEHISRYLGRPLRSHEEVQREQVEGQARPDRRKAPTRSATRDLVDKASCDEPNDR